MKSITTASGIGILSTFAMLLSGVQSAQGQRVLLVHSRENYVYAGIVNELSLFAEGMPCDAIMLRTDNGTIEKGNTACSYLIEPDSVGSARISVVRKSNGERIQDLVLQVNARPEPNPVLQKKTGGTISRSALAAQTGLFLVMPPELHLDVRVRTEGYTLSVIRDGRCVRTIYNSGVLFSEATRAVLASVKDNDHLIFSGMTYQLYNRKGSVRPVEFVVTKE